MEEVLVFQHDPFEDLGFFAEVLEKQGSDYRVVRLFHGEMPAEEWEHVSARRPAHPAGSGRRSAG